MILWVSLILSLPYCALGIGQAGCVAFDPSTSGSLFSVVSNGQAAPIYLSPNDWPGVHRAALDFASDVEAITGVKPQTVNVSSTDMQNTTFRPIIVGTLGKSALIDAIVNTTKLDVSPITGLWESFMSKEVANPLPGVDSAYVIIGSDKRGTIYALYDHSEQFGQSPWFWWADVPATKHEELYVTSEGCSHGPPTVKYRGIFLNDEQPALQNWAAAKFTNGTGSRYLNSPFNHLFYTEIFKLILRLKGNYLWPAVWGSAFNIDDDLNQPLADWYGVVMGTSHHEPMMRGTPNEWNIYGSGPWDYTTNKDNIYKYWVEGTERAKPFESIFTVGMRGAGDLPLSDQENIPLLEGVINDQQQILKDVFNGTNVADIPQVWALYNEVIGYYINGLKIPEHVTLLWPDDNWGDVRRYPTMDERNRTGGSGVYYHVDLVGDPRCYKWIISSQISKIYEQMSLAVDRNATRIWILNVGDLKPYERETEFFLNLGWNATRWNPDNVRSFVTSWAQREFQITDDGAELVADIIGNLTRFNARRKPEILTSTTYSLTNYREAENMVVAWDRLLNASTTIYDSLSEDKRPAFFQLVHHPVSASSNLGRMYISAGQNNLRASQARLSANAFGDQVEELFEKDFEFEDQYHTMLDGKWNHMMDQTHIGYAYWQQPMTNSMPMVTRVQARKQALPGVMRLSPEGTMAAWPGDNRYQCPNGYDCGTATFTFDSFSPISDRYVDVGHGGGTTSFDFTVTSNVSWLHISNTQGSLSPENTEKRIFVSVPDWGALAAGPNAALVTFNAQPTNQTYSFTYLINSTKADLPPSFTGFVESAGVVSIEAAHASRNTSVDGVSWKDLPGIGRTLSGVTPWPRGGKDANFTAGAGPSIEYDFYTFTGGNLTVTVNVSPSLNANGRDRPLAFAAQIDGTSVQSSYYLPLATPGYEPPQWGSLDGWAANSIISPKLTFRGVSKGAHTLKVFMIEPAVIVQKIIIDAGVGGLQPSYLGPPESIFVQGSQ